MTLAAPKKRWTIQEYYRIENDATEKHEFDDGEILAMSGGSHQHALIMANTTGLVHGALRGNPCRAYSSELRIRIKGHPRAVYPDISIICGDVRLDPDDPAGHSAMNPRVVVEVASPSTRDYDRKAKFDAYRQIDTLREFILIEQDEPRVEVFSRQDDGRWSFEAASGVEAVAQVRSLKIDLPLAEIYEGIRFEPKPDEPPTK